MEAETRQDEAVGGGSYSPVYGALAAVSRLPHRNVTSTNHTNLPHKFFC